VRIPARERNRLERLCRYVARPAIASERLSRTEEGAIHYGFRRPFSDGSTGVVLDPLTFLSRLAVLVPPPRSHLVVYSGVLAPNSALRSRIVPGRESRRKEPARRGQAEDFDAEGPASERSRCCRRRASWAELLKRVLERLTNCS
jgi:hypothetical protein